MGQDSQTECRGYAETGWGPAPEYAGQVEACAAGATHMAVSARSVRVQARARVHCTCKGVADLTCILDAELSAFEMSAPQKWGL